MRIPDIIISITGCQYEVCYTFRVSMHGLLGVNHPQIGPPINESQAGEAIEDNSI